MQAAAVVAIETTDSNTSADLTAIFRVDECAQQTFLTSTSPLPSSSLVYFSIGGSASSVISQTFPGIPKSLWMLYSGSSCHMTSDETFVNNCTYSQGCFLSGFCFCWYLSLLLFPAVQLHNTMSSRSTTTNFKSTFYQLLMDPTYL